MPQIHEKGLMALIAKGMNGRRHSFHPWVWIVIALSIAARMCCRATVAQTDWFYESSPPSHGASIPTSSGLNPVSALLRSQICID